MAPHSLKRWRAKAKDALERTGMGPLIETVAMSQEEWQMRQFTRTQDVMDLQALRDGRDQALFDLGVTRAEMERLTDVAVGAGVMTRRWQEERSARATVSCAEGVAVRLCTRSKLRLGLSIKMQHLSAHPNYTRYSHPPTHCSHTMPTRTAHTLPINMQLRRRRKLSRLWRLKAGSLRW
jgi:hypothetical protein